jgi:hypothetical protein
MDQGQNGKADSRYLADLQLAEHVLQSLLVVDHVVLCLHVKIHLRKPSKNKHHGHLGHRALKLTGTHQKPLKYFVHLHDSKGKPYAAVNTAPPHTARRKSSNQNQVQSLYNANVQLLYLP